MAFEPTVPPFTPDRVRSESSANRRRFLQALGAATVYVPPTLVALLAGTRPARAESEPGQTNSSETSVIADPGDAQTAKVNQVVTLDGSGSQSGQSSETSILTYEWSFASRPAGSTAVLENTTTVSPTFTPDKRGDYVVVLKVTAVTTAETSIIATASVTISTINSAPVADPGEAQTVHPIATVTLNGTQSYDDDEDSLTYEWSLQRPEGSQACLNNPLSATPSFEADLLGTYTATLVVNDGLVNSPPANVIISTNNSAPIANAGDSQSALVGTLITLNGTGSTDADSDSLTFCWSFVSVPTGSTAELNDVHHPTPSFTPDLVGTYIVGLIVNDGLANSAQSTAQVLAFVNSSVVVYEIQEVQQGIGSLDGSAFKNRNMQNALLNKLNAAIKKVSEGNYADALGQLRDDVLGKVSGNGGWLAPSGAQAAIYQQLQGIIAHIQTFL